MFRDFPREFFREFIEHFFPRRTARLDCERVAFLGREDFTDAPEGDKRTADLAAAVFTRGGEQKKRARHVEIEGGRGCGFAARRGEYRL